MRTGQSTSIRANGEDPASRHEMKERFLFDRVQSSSYSPAVRESDKLAVFIHSLPASACFARVDKTIVRAQGASHARSIKLLIIKSFDIIHNLTTTEKLIAISEYMYRRPTSALMPKADRLSRSRNQRHNREQGAIGSSEALACLPNSFALLKEYSTPP